MQIKMQQQINFQHNAISMTLAAFVIIFKKNARK